MKAALLLENLLGKISFLNYAVAPRAQLPILSGFLIKAEKGKLKISATDLETGIEIEVPASVEEEGAVAVPARAFSDFVSSLSEEKITIESAPSGVLVSGKKASARINALDEGEFPKIYEEKGEEIISVSEEGLLKGLPRVVFAASPDTGRPAFSGVLFRKEGDGLLMVATDSHRLSLDKTKGAVASEALKKGVVVSAKTLRVLLSRKGGGDARVYVSEKNNQIIFSQKDATLVGRLIETDYPEFEKIIPQDSSTKTEFSGGQLLAALKTASVFARDNANIVKMSIKKDSLVVSAKSPTLGENTVEIEARTTGEENEIAFNGHYLLELLQNVDDEEMFFQMTGPLNPGVFKSKKNPDFVHLIMPIRVRDEELK